VRSAARRCRAKGFHLRGLTRKAGRRAGRRRWPRSGRRHRTSSQGDLDDEATLRPCVWPARGGRLQRAEHGGGRASSGKRRQGKRLAKLAREGRASNTSSTRPWDRHTRRTGVPAHFDKQMAHRGNRARPQLPLACDSCVRCSSWRNLLAPFSLQGSTLAWALGPGHEAADDCGGGHRLVSARPRAFTDAGTLNGRENRSRRRRPNDAGSGGDPEQAAAGPGRLPSRQTPDRTGPCSTARIWRRCWKWFERVGYRRRPSAGLGTRGSGRHAHEAPPTSARRTTQGAPRMKAIRLGEYGRAVGVSTDVPTPTNRTRTRFW